MLEANRPALVLAPMDGITDAAMRALQGESGAFSFAVTEFLRVSETRIPVKVFRRDVPELLSGGVTSTGMPVQVQLLGGDCDLMALSAISALKAGATAIDINFGCPAPTVNRHDGGASLLKHPCRIRDIVSAVRQAVPPEIPVSAKVRLGWENIDDIDLNAQMAAEGGASWLTIHARTRVQGYTPPVYWPQIGRIQRNLGIPVVANGDIWNIEDFHRCQDETGCSHYMIGRSALANPGLPLQIARELGITGGSAIETDWLVLFRRLGHYMLTEDPGTRKLTLARIKQWMKLAHLYGEFPFFDELKTVTDLDDMYERLAVLSCDQRLAGCA